MRERQPEQLLWARLVQRGMHCVAGARALQNGHMSQGALLEAWQLALVQGACRTCRTVQGA